MTNENATAPPAATTAQPEDVSNQFWMIGINEGRGSELLFVRVATGEVLARYRVLGNPTRGVMRLEPIVQEEAS